MFRKNDIYKIGSHKGSLQDRGREGSFPPSKKARLGDNYTAQQARVEDDVWGEDLDANTVEECFILASQALSQVCTTNGCTYHMFLRNNVNHLQDFTATHPRRLMLIPSLL